jgi:hypothetical protein
VAESWIYKRRNGGGGVGPIYVFYPIPIKEGTIFEIALSTLQENMRKFLRSPKTILSIPPEELGGLTLDTVEVSAQLDGATVTLVSGVWVLRNWLHRAASSWSSKGRAE